MWPSGQVTHYNVPTGQVTHYNVTIWAGNPLQYTILYWAGNPLQYTIKKTAKNKKSGWSSKWLVSWFLHLSVKVVCQSTVFKVSKKKKRKKKKRKQMFFLYLLFFINLLHKAKRKWNFLISSRRKYYKERATVITQFLTILF
jgi:uncharacterized membrane protein SirB2